MRVKLNIDGGVRTEGVKGPTGGSTGPASMGYVISNEDGSIIDKGGDHIGIATVNEAEYSALIAGLYNCALKGATEVTVESDSQVLVRQMNGEYAVRAENLKEFHAEAKTETRKFDRVVFIWVPRAKNKLADKITEDFLGPR